MDLVEQIIELKKEVGVMEKNATLAMMREWYSYALEHGFVETIMESGRLLGFAEWVRLPEIPVDKYNWTHLVNWETAKTDPVMFVMNMCTRQKGILWKLKEMMSDKNKDYKVLCWHSKRRGRIYVI